MILMLFRSYIYALSYAPAWVGLGIVLVYYLIMTAVFRRSGRRGTKIARYEPPAGISPAVAATVREKGRFTRAFAAALVSLSGKGYLKIQQEKHWIVVQKLREADESLPHEEAVILLALFEDHQDTRTISVVDDAGLCKTFMQFEAAIESVTVPRLIATHTPFWLLGIAGSLVAVLPAFRASFFGPRETSLPWIAYESIWIILGGFSLVAALHVWPGTLRKVASALRRDGRPFRRLNMNDAIPFFLLFSALLGFAFLANMISAAFALLLTTALAVNFVFRYGLEGLTPTGRRVMAELDSFRQFLAETSSDRLNRENQAGHSPSILEKYTSYALALGVEHAWAEEFVEDITGFLQFDLAYRWRIAKMPDLSIGDADKRGFIQLNISSRK